MGQIHSMTIQQQCATFPLSNTNLRSIRVLIEPHWQDITDGVDSLKVVSVS